MVDAETEEAAMLDAMMPGAAVFEPEEAGVLKAACDLAVRKIGQADDDATREELARLVHNLGRSRLKLKRRLADATDAAALAEEAADLLGYLREASDLPADHPDLAARQSPRTVPIFPPEIRVPPTTVLRPR